jgi:hypothetical protein
MLSPFIEKAPHGGVRPESLPSSVQAASGAFLKPVLSSEISKLSFFLPNQY